MCVYLCETCLCMHMLGHTCVTRLRLLFSTLYFERKLVSLLSPEFTDSAKLPDQ